MKTGSIFNSKCENLEHAICLGRLEIASDPTDEMQGIQLPGNLALCKSSLVVGNVYGMCIPNFARMASLLIQEPEKVEPKSFDEHIDEELSAFTALNEPLTFAAVFGTC